MSPCINRRCNLISVTKDKKEEGGQVLHLWDVRARTKDNANFDTSDDWVLFLLSAQEVMRAMMDQFADFQGWSSLGYRKWSQNSWQDTSTLSAIDDGMVSALPNDLGAMQAEGQGGEWVRTHSGDRRFTTRIIFHSFALNATDERTSDEGTNGAKFMTRERDTRVECSKSVKWLTQVWRRVERFFYKLDRMQNRFLSETLSQPVLSSFARLSTCKHACWFLINLLCRSLTEPCSIIR